VIEADGVPKVNWISLSQMNMHTKVLQKMQQVLLCENDYAYLSESCKARLDQIRKDVRLSGIIENTVVSLSEKTFAIFPWLGTRQLYTLQIILHQQNIESVISPGTFLPIYLEANFNGSKKELLEIINQIKKNDIDVYSFNLPDKIEIPSKFNKYIPRELLRKEFIEDYLDIEGLRVELYHDD
jgi:ATP-dependent Lhr-like helicase